MGLKEQINNSIDNQLHEVDVHEWNIVIYIKQISLADRIKLYDYIDNNKDVKWTVMLLLYSIADKEGVRVFGDNDYDLLANKSAIVLDRLAGIAAQHNRLVKDSVDEAKKN